MNFEVKKKCQLVMATKFYRGIVENAYVIGREKNAGQTSGHSCRLENGKIRYNER